MIDVLIAIAEDAGVRLLERHQEFSTETKTGEWDLVTSADKDLDSFLRERLLESFPEIPAVAEESPSEVTPSGLTFLVDPLDGTKDFVFRGEDYCVMIGLLSDGRPTCGVIHIPRRGVTVYAEEGKGAFVRDEGGIRRLRVSDTSELSDATMVARRKRGEDRPADALDESFPVRKRIPRASSGAKYHALATGEADLVLNTNMQASKWDTCAAEAILRESGGRLTDLDGAPLDYGKSGNCWGSMFIATNGLLHEEALSHARQFLEKNGRGL